MSATEETEGLDREQYVELARPLKLVGAQMWYASY